MSRRQWTVVSALIGLCLVGLGSLCGVVTERVRFDQVRQARIGELDAATTRVRARLMLLEKDTTRTATREDAR
jgi:hypothetical protein